MATPETNPHPIVDRAEEAPGVEAPQTRRERFRVLSSRHRPRRGRTWLIFAVVLVLVVAGYFLWRYLGSYESADDAQVDVHLYPVSGRISGYVTTVNVNDNQYVEQGTVLVEIDPRDYQVAVDKAKADLASAEATARSLNITVPVTSVSRASQLSFAARASTAAAAAANANEAAAAQAVQQAKSKLEQAEANRRAAQTGPRHACPFLNILFLAASERATTAGCCSFRSAEIA